MSNIFDKIIQKYNKKREVLNRASLIFMFFYQIIPHPNNKVNNKNKKNLNKKD